MASVQWSIDMAESIANVSRGQGTKRDALNIGVGYAMMGLSAIPGGYGDDAARTVGGFRMTETVASHAKDVVTKGDFKGELARPFLNSPLTIQEIMATGKGIPDPGGVAGALRWAVPGTFRGRQGTWELVISDDLILHFNFIK